MEVPLLPNGLPQTCRWCNTAKSRVIFENAALCTNCHEKAILATQKPSVCEICRSLFLEQEVTRAMLSEEGFQHWLQSDIRESAENGCGLCRIFLLQDPNPDIHRLHAIPLSLFAGMTSNDSPANGASDVQAKDVNSLSFSSEPQFLLTLSVSALPDDPAARFISQRPVETDLGSENTIHQIQTWLDECNIGHTESLVVGQTTARQSHLPTRLIDVGLEDTDDVKLYQPSTTTRDQYVALSYCWGTKPFLRTLLGNIEAHKDMLDMLKLPKTFKDAIMITRRLGFRYVWIDALCIIQDSADDKMKEIGTMEEIYSEASLTVAIVSHSSVTDGFLKPESPLTVTLPYRCPDGEIGSVLVSPQKTADMWQQPLYTRAWCLQENLLSPRMLLYTDTEVVWQCQSSPMKRPDTVHVIYQYDNPELGSSPFRRLPANLDNPNVAKIPGVPPEDKPRSCSTSQIDEINYRHWKFVVEGYTRRKLSVLSDRLPALAGVAQKFKEAWGDEYCAGLWKRQFIPSLAWRRVDLPVAPYVLEKYRAPTWSWASIEGPVNFSWRFDLGNARGLGAKLVSCIVEPLSPDLAPLGEVLGAKAVLEASIIPASELPMRDYGGERGKKGGIVYLDAPGHLTRWPGFANVLNEEMIRSWWCLLLGEGPSGSGKMMETTAMLLAVVEGEEGVYRREGLWVSTHKGASKAWVGKEKKRVVTIV